MPIKKVQGGYKWGDHGKVYPTRAGAERQAAAAHANGYTGDSVSFAAEQSLPQNMLPQRYNMAYGVWEDDD